MINTVGLRKADILAALAAEAGGCSWTPARLFKPPKAIVPGLFWAVIQNSLVVLDLRADDGFDEANYNRVCGWRAAQRAVDKLRAEKGGAA